MVKAQFLVPLFLLVFLTAIAVPARAATYISNCTTLTTADTYYLTADINFTGYNAICFNIRYGSYGLPISPLVLDCQGHTIDGRGPDWANKAVYTYYPSYPYTTYNVQIKNCRLINFMTGIEFYKVFESTINNNTIINTYNPIVVVGSSNNTIYNNHLASNSACIYLGVLSLSDTTSIYNNILREDRIFIYWDGYQTLIDVPSLNTTRHSGTNIVGGPNIGGNYWTNPSGTGYSDTCTDDNTDGFCDIPFDICVRFGSNCFTNGDWPGYTRDYLPLYHYTPPTPPVCQVCDIRNLPIGSMGLGAIPGALVCGMLNILFCVPILFALVILGMVGIWYWRKLRG
jgi:hypothetical protein